MTRRLAMKFSMLACALTATLACVACSQGPQTPAAPASSTSSPGKPATQATPTAVRIYLYDLLQRPDFTKTLDALPDAQTLPAWVRQGGTATPARTVQV